MAQKQSRNTNGQESVGSLEQIHWHEGLFLQQHHLQAMQRSAQQGLTAERELQCSHPYGLITFSYRVAELQKQLLRVEHLRAVLPSGRLVDVPGNADLDALDFSQRFKSTRPFTVYLAVPNWREDQPNTLADDSRRAGIKRAYAVRERVVCDENTGDSEQTIAYRRLNARLLIEGDDLDGYDCLPIMRIEHSAGDELGQPVEDPQFAPPCFHLRGSDDLFRKVRELTTNIDTTRQKLAAQIARAGYEPDTMAGKVIEQMMRLAALSRAAGRLNELIRIETLTPFQVFVELRAILGDFSALRPGDPGLFDSPAYDHRAPFEPFVQLITKINSQLQISDVAQYRAIEFSREDRCLAAKLTDDDFPRAQSWFLGVRSDQAPATIAQTVHNGNSFKLMSRSQITKAIFGIELQQEHVPPAALPMKSGLHYFRLNLERSADRWNEIKREHQIAVRWKEMARSDFELTLFYVLRSEGDV